MQNSYMEEGQEGSVNCAKCNQLPDDILILTCDHNLCLMCASKNLQREHKKGSHTFQTVVCEMCDIATVLDPSSASELLSMYPMDDFENKNPKDIRVGGGSKVELNHNLKQNFPLQNVRSSQQSYYHGASVQGPLSGATERNLTAVPTNRNLRPERESCKDHPDEEVNYFCFDCVCSPICSECVVHGSHRGHEVATLKKSYPIIVGKAEELGLNINTKIDELLLHQQKLEARKRDLVDQTTAIKQQMANAIDELRQRLDKKERELMQNADMFLEKNIGEIDSYIRLINGRNVNLNSTIEVIKHEIQNADECEIMNFYAQNYQKIQQTVVDSDLPQLKDIPKQSNLKCEVEIESLNQFIEAIEGVQLQLHSFEADIVDDQGVNKSRITHHQQNSQYFQQPKKLNTVTKDTYKPPQRDNSNQPNVFDIAYRKRNPLQLSVAQTMNKLAEQKGYQNVSQSYTQKQMATPPQHETYY